MVQGTAGFNAVDPLMFDNRIASKWLTSFEAADYLGITTNALRIMVCRGKVQTFKLGQRLRFRLEDLRALIKGDGDQK